MKETLTKLFRGCIARQDDVRHSVRMGPLGSGISHIGVQITDSPYVAVSHENHDPDGEGRA